MRLRRVVFGGDYFAISSKKKKRILWTLTLLLIVVNAQDAVHPAASDDEEQQHPRNASFAAADDSASAIDNGGERDEERKFAKPEFLEVSQNSGVANDVLNTYTLSDTVTAELQQFADMQTIAGHEATPFLEEEAGRDKAKNRSSGRYESAPENLAGTVEIEKDVNVEEKEEGEKNGSESHPTPKEDGDDWEDGRFKSESGGEAAEKNLTKPEEPQEDIPSFSEWAQKQLEQAEKNKDQSNASSQSQNANNGKPSSGAKLRSKNYASPDCGAKIIAANPEAQSANAVLSPSRDEYKLNACTSRIWFIVELCEAVQAKKIDLANFELFSSSPKDFSVSVSDRFPSREWANVGHFTARDERDVQSFDLHPHLFGKYIKVEVKSHHGSEHFCPISLFRVYGTSEFEVLEKEDPVHASAAIDDDDDDETLDSEGGESPKNLFSSATDAVISIVKKAAQVLGNKGNASNQTDEQSGTTTGKTFRYTPLVTSCSTPSHLVVCDNCSDVLFGQVYELLSCRSRHLQDLLRTPIIRDFLCNSNLCKRYGLDFRGKGSCAASGRRFSYVSAFYTERYLAALCNTLAVLENKVVLNVSSHCDGNDGNSGNVSKSGAGKTGDETPESLVEIETSEPPVLKPTKDADDPPSTDDRTEELRTTQQQQQVEPETVAAVNYTSQIKPTRAHAPEQVLKHTDFTAGPAEDLNLVQPTESLNIQDNTNNNQENTNNNNNKNNSSGQVFDGGDGNGLEGNVEPENASESSEGYFEPLESLSGGDFKEDLSTGSIPAASSTPVPQAGQQKESVFLRLSNRIKALERNMSLSSQYLEELSRRYKKQVEEMQKTVDKTLLTLTEEGRKRDEKNKQLEEKINDLTVALENLLSERKSWSGFWRWTWFFAPFLTIIWLFFGRRKTAENRANGDADRKAIENDRQHQRRKSIDVIFHKTETNKKKRRSSEEALKISGTYEHLLVPEIELTKYYSNNTNKTINGKERKRRKRKQLSRSNSFTTLTEEADVSGGSSETSNSSQRNEAKVNGIPASPEDWVVNSLIRNSGAESVPFPLEESEHSTLEPLEYNDVGAEAPKPPAYVKTAMDIRLNRSSSHNGSICAGDKNLKQEKHRKTASLDETNAKKNAASPGKRKQENSDPNKTKRKGLRRIFKKVF